MYPTPQRPFTRRAIFKKRPEKLKMLKKKQNKNKKNEGRNDMKMKNEKGNYTRGDPKY